MFIVPIAVFVTS